MSLILSHKQTMQLGIVAHCVDITVRYRFNHRQTIAVQAPPPLNVDWSTESVNHCNWSTGLHVDPTSPTLAQGAMAAFTVARSGSRLISGLRTSFGGLARVKHGVAAATASRASVQQQQCRLYAVGHLSVKERIDKKRQEALLGGGQPRIDAQHRKVTSGNTHLSG